MRLIGDNWSPWEGVEEEIDNGDILDFDEIRKMKDIASVVKLLKDKGIEQHLIDKLCCLNNERFSGPGLPGNVQN